MKLKKISLRALNDSAIKNREQRNLLGGEECGCGCQGPSSLSSNMSYNYAGGKWSGQVCNCTGYDGSDKEIVCRPHA